jgi:NAD(P)-dependent dehydrogenase (short-subunit alcohol dehydrogenase family)
MSRPLSGKIALITGSSRGIGRAIAEGLAAEGALVAVHYGANRGAADETVGAIKAAGGDAFAVGADLSRPDGPAALFAALDAELTARTGGTAFDILVNNAGVAPFEAFEETRPETFDQIIAVNVRAPYFVAQEAAKRLRDGGRVINLSSAVTRVGVTGAPAYSASKGFIDSFTLSLASVLAPRNITVNAIAPGVIATDMAAPMVGSADGAAWVLSKQALKRLGQPEDIAGVARFLAGPHGGWTTGQVIDASGGSQIAF